MSLISPPFSEITLPNFQKLCPISVAFYDWILFLSIFLDFEMYLNVFFLVYDDLYFLKPSFTNDQVSQMISR